MDSVVNGVNVFTVEQKRLIRVLGHLPPSLMSRVDSCLKAALELD